MKQIIFSNVKLVLPDRLVRGSLLVNGPVIAAVSEGPGIPPEWNSPGPGAPSNGPELINGGGLYLSPGFIDIHNHGRLGCDVMDGTPDALDTIARGQAEHGVTAFLAGTSTIPWEKSLKAIGQIAAYCRRVGESGGTGGLQKDSACRAWSGARCLGIYSEGALFSQEKRGAHDPAYLKSVITPADIDALLEAAGDTLKVLSLSPELPGALEAISRLAGQGIVTAAAHTNAAYDEALAGINAGFTLATHTFNAMRALSHQEPGILGAVLNDSRVSCELIADGIHLNPVILSLVYKLKGPDHIILISDSVSANGLPDGRYESERRIVIVDRDSIRLEDGRLAGSTLSLDRAVRNMIRLGGAGLCHAVQMASLNPARILGVDKHKGSIEAGKDADLLLFDENIAIKKVFIGGNPFEV
ncbi:N-acetylglucosamine-6-phosphate deacetylase [Spirochaetia bacterium]|nr:N-acetylglucosamine-6-phosphate deacetylase [Spirochaetia bacterium]